MRQCRPLQCAHLHPFFTGMLLLSTVMLPHNWATCLPSFQEAGGATPLSVQDRDGCKTQLEALRDKISSLSRELATHEDAETDKDAAICGLKGNIIGLEDTVQSLQKHSAGLQGQLEAAWAEASDTAARMTDRHAEVALLREQAGSVARAWKHEQLLLVQVRFTPCMNQSTPHSVQVCITAHSDKRSTRQTPSISGCVPYAPVIA